ASSKGGSSVAPVSAAMRAAVPSRSACVLRQRTTVAPSARVPRTLTSGAPSGITTVAGTPNAAAAYATPWAWLPDECVTTPRRLAGSGSAARKLVAPRTLNDPVSCSDSAFTYTSRSGSPSTGSGRSGVRLTRPRRRATAARTSTWSMRTFYHRGPRRERGVLLIRDTPARPGRGEVTAPSGHAPGGGAPARGPAGRARAGPGGHGAGLGRGGRPGARRGRGAGGWRRAGGS